MDRLALAASLLVAVTVPAGAQTNQAQPGYAPAYPPGYTVTPQPTYPPPAYQTPAYQPPAYAPPAYQRPAYSAPPTPAPYSPPPSAAPPSYPPPSSSYGYQNSETGARPGNVIGTGSSLPYSGKASNIDSYDTRSQIAPRLPTPAAGDDNTPRAYLLSARQAIAAGRTGAAQEALERAESRMLTRTVPRSQGSVPDYNPVIRDVGSARRALAAGDYAGATRLIDRVLTAVR